MVVHLLACQTCDQKDACSDPTISKAKVTWCILGEKVLCSKCLGINLYVYCKHQSVIPSLTTSIIKIGYCQQLQIYKDMWRFRGVRCPSQYKNNFRICLIHFVYGLDQKQRILPAFLMLDDAEKTHKQFSVLSMQSSLNLFSQNQ